MGGALRPTMVVLYQLSYIGTANLGILADSGRYFNPQAGYPRKQGGREAPRCYGK